MWNSKILSCKEEYNIYQRQFDFSIESNHFYDSDKNLQKVSNFKMTT